MSDECMEKKCNDSFSLFSSLFFTTHIFSNLAVDLIVIRNDNQRLEGKIVLLDLTPPYCNT